MNQFIASLQNTLNTLNILSILNMIQFARQWVVQDQIILASFPSFLMAKVGPNVSKEALDLNYGAPLKSMNQMTTSKVNGDFVANHVQIQVLPRL